MYALRLNYSNCTVNTDSAKCIVYNPDITQLTCTKRDLDNNSVSTLVRM